MKALSVVVLIGAAFVLLGCVGEDRSLSPPSPAESLGTIEAGGQQYSIMAQAPDQWRERTDAFNVSAKEAGATERVASCSNVVDVPVGVADGNHSYGAICSTTDGGARSDVMVCNDVMVGHFKIAPITKPPSGRELAEFVVANCFGG